jgi:hypothetical protein
MSKKNQLENAKRKEKRNAHIHTNKKRKKEKENVALKGKRLMFEFGFLF